MSDGTPFYWIDGDCPLHTEPNDYIDDDPEEVLLDKYLLPRVNS